MAHDRQEVALFQREGDIMHRVDRLRSDRVRFGHFFNQELSQPVYSCLMTKSGSSFLRRRIGKRAPSAQIPAPKSSPARPMTDRANTPRSTGRFLRIEKLFPMTKDKDVPAAMPATLPIPASMRTSSRNSLVMCPSFAPRAFMMPISRDRSFAIAVKTAQTRKSESAVERAI